MNTLKFLENHCVLSYSLVQIYSNRKVELKTSFSLIDLDKSMPLPYKISLNIVNDRPARRLRGGRLKEGQREK